MTTKTKTMTYTEVRLSILKEAQKMGRALHHAAKMQHLLTEEEQKQYAHIPDLVQEFDLAMAEERLILWVFSLPKDALEPRQERPKPMLTLVKT